MADTIKLEQVLELNEEIRLKGWDLEEDRGYTTYSNNPFARALTLQQAEMAVELNILIGIARPKTDEDDKAPGRYSYVRFKKDEQREKLNFFKKSSGNSNAILVIDPVYDLLQEGTSLGLYELCVNAMTKDMEFMLKNHTRTSAPDRTGEWCITDDDTFQCRQCRPDRSEFAHELIQVLEFPNHFRVAQATIYPSDYTMSEILDVLGTYGFDLDLFLNREEADTLVFDWAYVSEMLFELEAIDFADGEFSTRKKAFNHVKKVTGLKPVE